MCSATLLACALGNLIFRDDFTQCVGGKPSASDWEKINKKWPKIKNITSADNAGVNSKLVHCADGTLQLTAHGDTYDKNDVIGWLSDGTVANSSLQFKPLPSHCDTSKPGDCYEA